MKPGSVVGSRGEKDETTVRILVEDEDNEGIKSTSNGTGLDL